VGSTCTDVVAAFVVLVMEARLKLGAMLPAAKTGMRPIVKLAPLLVFVANENVRSAVISALEMSTAWLLSAAAAAMS